MNHFTVNVIVPGTPALQFVFYGDGSFYSVDNKKVQCGSYSLKISANGDVWGILSDGNREFSGHITRGGYTISDLDTYEDGETFGFERV